VVAALEGFIRATAALERTEYDYRIEAVAAGDRVAVGRDFEVEAFATDHVVPSLGYHLVHRKHRLKEGYRGLAGPELARLRAEGVATEEPVEELLLSYCGDTGAGIFDLDPRVFETQVLLLECTFLDPGKRDSAARYKHLHFEDLAARAERFGNRAIVLHHLSRRHRVADLRRLVEERLPGLASRVHLLGEIETQEKA
jgi:ribonuclease Z